MLGHSKGFLRTHDTLLLRPLDTLRSLVVGSYRSLREEHDPDGLFCFDGSTSESLEVKRERSLIEGPRSESPNRKVKNRNTNRRDEGRKGRRDARRDVSFGSFKTRLKGGEKASDEPRKEDEIIELHRPSNERDPPETKQKRTKSMISKEGE